MMVPSKFRKNKPYLALAVSVVFATATTPPIHAQPQTPLSSQSPAPTPPNPSGARQSKQAFGGQLAVFFGDESAEFRPDASVEFSSDSSRILTFKRFKSAEYLSGYLRLWDTNGDFLAIIQHSNNKIKSAIFSPDSQQVLTTDDQNVHLWDRSGNLLTIFSHKNLFDAQFSPDSRHILTISKQDARLWDRKGKILAIIQYKNSEFQRAIFSSDSHRILTIDNWEKVRLWDGKGNLLAILENTKSSNLTNAIFSPYGNYIITEYDEFKNGCKSYLWDKGGNLLTTIQRECRKDSKIIFSSGEKHLIATSDNTVYLWDKRGKLIIKFLHHQGKIRELKLSPSGRHILTRINENNSIVYLWDIEGNLLATLQHQGPIHSLQFSPDGRHILTDSTDKTARLWDLEGKTIVVLQNQGEWIRDPVFSPDGNYILAKSGNTALLWDKQGNPLAVLQGHAGINSIHRAIFSPDGRYIVTIKEYDDKTSRLWDVSAVIAIQMQQRTALQSFETEVSNRNAQLIKVQGSIATLSPDGKYILTAGRYHEARLWDMQGKLLTVFPGHESWISGIAFSPDSNQILTEAYRAIYLWNREGKLLAVLRHNDLLRDVAFSPDGNYILAVGGLGSTSSLWDRQGNRLVTFPEGNAKFGPDGRFILTFADKANIASLWDTKGNLLTVFKGHQESIWDAIFSPDGNRILTSSSDKTARLWNRKGNLLAVFQGHEDSVYDAAFSPDGNRILTTGGITSRLWDTQGKLLKVLEGHEELIFITKFSPNGSRILTAGRDHTARLWDREGNPLAIFRGHEIFVTDAEFTPDGRYILTTSIQDDTTRLWDISAAIAANAEQATALQAYQASVSNKNAPQAEAALKAAIQLNQQGTLASRQQALQKLNEALKLYRGDNNLAKAAYSLRLIGNIRANLGQFQAALDAYTQALPLSRQAGVKAEEAAIFNSLGQLYTDLADPKTALDYHTQALPLLYQLNDKGSAAATFTNIGDIHADTNQWQQALDAYTQALIISRPAGDLAAEATALAGIGRTYMAAKDWGTALNAYQQALIITRHLNDKIHESAILNQTGKIHAALGDKATALKHYNQALLISQEVGNRLGEATTRSTMAAFYADQGNAADAIQSYQKAIAITESIRGEIRLEPLKSSFVSERIDTYARLINLLAQQGDFTAAFNYAERAKARAFLDQIASGPIDYRAGADAQLLQQAQDLSQQIDAVERQLTTLRSRPKNQWDQTAISAASTQLATLRKADDRLLTQIQLQSPAAASLVTVDAAPLVDIQRLLEPDTTFVEYFVTGDRTFAFILTRNSFNTVPLNISRADLVKTITALRDFPSLDDKIPADFQQLNQILIEPLQAHLKTSRLIIVPHDILHYLPFAALTDGSRYLGDRYTLSFLPSANVLRFLPASKPSPTNSLLALGDPISAEQGGLSNARSEVEAISSLFSTTPFVGKEATETRLRSQAPTSNILHLAVHGKIDPINPRSSALYLTADDQNNGRLEVGEIYGLNLTRNTNLVVLSACQTSIGQQSRGDEIVGLNRAFLYAGTPTVLSSLWDVDDAATSLLMKQFYTHLRTGSDPATALQQAQQTIRQDPRYVHPYFWSAFSITGRAEP